jgi:hypothetical protein
MHEIKSATKPDRFLNLLEIIQPFKIISSMFLSTLNKGSLAFSQERLLLAFIIYCSLQ